MGRAKYKIRPVSDIDLLVRFGTVSRSDPQVFVG